MILHVWIKDYRTVYQVKNLYMKQQYHVTPQPDEHYLRYGSCIDGRTSQWMHLPSYNNNHLLHQLQPSEVAHFW